MTTDGTDGGQANAEAPAGSAEPSPEVARADGAVSAKEAARAAASRVRARLRGGAMGLAREGDVPVAETPEKEHWVSRLLRRKPRLWPWAMALALSVFVASVAAVGFSWFWLTPRVWDWGWGPESHWFKAIVSVFGCLITAVYATFLPFLAFSPVRAVFSLYGEAEATLDEKHLDDVQTRREKAEEELLDKDESGIIPVVQYSRMQLEEYYTIGLHQTRGTFRYCIMAMTAGFVVILAGMLPRILPMEVWGIPKVSEGVSVVVVASGALIEFISAMFLWMYRSAINRLTYFYNRQVQLHEIVVCFRVAATMKNSDGAKMLIIRESLARLNADAARASGIRWPFSRGSKEAVGERPVADVEGEK